jgi:WD40 repeat protein
LSFVLVAACRCGGADVSATRSGAQSPVDAVSGTLVSSGNGAPPPTVAPSQRLPCDSTRLVEGRAMPPVASRPKPAKGVLHEEPTFHTCIVRVTDHAREGLAEFSRNDYSRRQAFNADSSRFLTVTGDGTWRIYDVRTLESQKAPDLAGDAEPHWHPTDPNILFYGANNGGLEIMALDIRKGTSQVVIDLRGKLPWPNAARAWSKSEGSPSRNARYWGFQVETDDFQILGFAVWDMVDKRLVGSIPVRSRPDHVSMSPSGRWFVSSGEETIAWSRDFKQKKIIRKGTEHSDLAIGANGHDYYVSIDYQSNEGWVFMTDLDTGERTDLFPTYVERSATALHISGKAYDKPGWVLVSTYMGDGPKPQWFMEKIFAMELAKEPRIYPIASHHSDVGGEYFAEPHATVNRDFTRILFNSNWGKKASRDIDAYLVRLAPNAFP